MILAGRAAIARVLAVVGTCSAVVCAVCAGSSNDDDVCGGSSEEAALLQVKHEQKRTEVLKQGNCACGVASISFLGCGDPVPCPWWDDDFCHASRENCEGVGSGHCGGKWCGGGGGGSPSPPRRRSPSPPSSAPLPPFSPSGTSGGNLQLNCEGDGFADCFWFSTAPDKTGGYVDYVSQAEAERLGLYKIVNGRVRMSGGPGDEWRVKSIRIESHKRFNAGSMYVIDIEHMPTGPGTWPAWWSTGPDWPHHGEIDTIESVNDKDSSYSHLHSSWGCKQYGHGIGQHYCDAPNGKATEGCGLTVPGNSGGEAFNSHQGGVYVTKWTDAGISMWMFPRSSIPQDIKDGSPDPSSWGNPYVTFHFGDDCPSWHFSDHELIINLNWCGDWAGSAYPGGKWRCDEFVRDPRNRGQLTEAYWLINYVKVYKV